MDKAVDRSTSNGQHLQVWWSDNGNILYATLDGKGIHNSLGYGTLRTPQTIGTTTVRHYVGGHHGRPAVGLTEEDVAAIDQSRDTIRAAYRQSLAGLLDQRRSLLADIRYAAEADAEDRERAWAREDERRWARQDQSGKIAAARQALADFDAAHPEVLSAWDAQAERRREAELTDQIAYPGE